MIQLHQTWKYICKTCDTAHNYVSPIFMELIFQADGSMVLIFQADGFWNSGPL